MLGHYWGAWLEPPNGVEVTCELVAVPPLSNVWAVVDLATDLDWGAFTHYHYQPPPRLDYTSSNYFALSYIWSASILITS